MYFSWQMTFYTHFVDRNHTWKSFWQHFKKAPQFFAIILVSFFFFFGHINRILITSAFLPLTPKAFQLQISNY